MKHKLQSSIFLQPIDQHFFVSKNQSFPEDESDYFKSRENFKLDCLDNSTESDSAESKNENDFFSESIKSSLRKISQIAEKSAEEKGSINVNNLDYEKKEKFNFSGEENSYDCNSHFTKQYHSEKNFHVPHFLLLDSDDEQSAEKFSSNTSSGSKEFFETESDGSAKPHFPFCPIRKKSLIEMNNNFINFSISKDICEIENFNKNNKIKNLNKSLFGKKDNLEKTKITDLLHCDWKSKINAQRFLKFNAFRKKVFDHFNGKGQSKKNKNNSSSNNVNNPQYNQQKNFQSFKTNSNSNNYSSQSSSNLIFNQTKIKVNNFNYMNNNNFFYNSQLNFNHINGNYGNDFNSNQRKNSQNFNLNLNQHQQTFANQIKFPVQHPVKCTTNATDKSATFDMFPTNQINSYNDNNFNLRKNSTQNFLRIPVPNSLSGDINSQGYNSFPMENQTKQTFPQMIFSSNYNDNNSYNYNNNLKCNFPKSSTCVNYSNNFYNFNNNNNNTFYN